MGVSVAQSCETALYYYQKAAKKGTVCMHMYMYLLVQHYMDLIDYCMLWPSLTYTCTLDLQKQLVFFMTTDCGLYIYIYLTNLAVRIGSWELVDYMNTHV